MNIYLSAWHSRKVEMRTYRDTLQSMGHIVTSSWIDYQGFSSDAELLGMNENLDYLNKAAVLAERDLHDLDHAQLMILFTTFPTKGTGGHSVELGYSMAMHKAIAVIGPRENIFQATLYVNWYPDWQTFLKRAYLPSYLPTQEIQ